MIRLLVSLSLLVQSHGLEPVVEPAQHVVVQQYAPPAAPVAQQEQEVIALVELAAQAAAQPANSVNNVAANTPANAAKAAAKAANAAANAANVAVAAANTAANAAVSANMAANAAVNAKSAAAVATSPAEKHAALTNAKSAAATAASTAANAAASANVAASAAASANVAAGNAANAAATIPGTMASPSHVWSTGQWASGLFAGLTFAMFVKALCVAGNVLVQVSPLPSVRRWEGRGCTGEADAAPYVSIAFGGCQWCFYGIFAWLVTQRSGFLILVYSNGLGAVLGSYYVSAFFRNCRDDEALRSLQKYLSAVTALALLQVCALSTLPPERALFLIGIISSFCSFINATSVLVTVPQVVRTKDSRSIPGPYAVANLLSSMVWSLCGWILSDPCVMMPNIFSTLCAAASLGIKAFYPSKDNENLLSCVEEGVKDTAFQLAAKKKALAIPMEFTPMKPAASKITAGTFQEKFLPAPAPETACAALCGDGTGGTGGF